MVCTYMCAHTCVHMEIEMGDQDNIMIMKIKFTLATPCTEPILHCSPEHNIVFGMIVLYKSVLVM